MLGLAFFLVVPTVDAGTLHRAAERGDVESIKALIAIGADANSKDDDGHTPLHRAAFAGRAEAIEALLDTGADVNPKNDHGETPLHLAASDAQAETVGLLLAAGAHLAPKDGGGDTPLVRALRYGGGYLDAAKLLVESGADVHTLDEDDKALLAASEGQSDPPWRLGRSPGGLSPEIVGSPDSCPVRAPGHGCRTSGAWTGGRR